MHKFKVSKLQAPWLNDVMSAEYKFESHRPSENFHGAGEKGRVKLTDLMSRLQEEKKKERNSNIALSVAAVSAVTVFGIILSL